MTLLKLRLTSTVLGIPLLLALALVFDVTFMPGESTSFAQGKKLQRVTRLFYHEDSTATLRWADVVLSGQNLRLQLTSPVTGWPKTDPDKQHLTQLQTTAGWLLSGIRDHEGAKFGSGWILTHSGVRRIPHGDHEDWRYDPQPRVADFRLDSKQGNPAHVYVYDSIFYLANDLLNGYTRINPNDYQIRGGQVTRRGSPEFIPGGGNHITLAVDRDRAGYACWIDRDGENKGRLDISVIRPGGQSFILYTLSLPWGGLHGATINSGKLFLAPEQDIVWMPLLQNLAQKPDSLTYHVIELGQENGNPLRTGAFTNWKNYVLFVAGRDKPLLGFLEATQSAPKLLSVPLSSRKGLRPTAPKVVQTLDGKTLALVCQDKPGDAQLEEILDVVDLDPNGDGSFQDAKLLSTITLGPSAVEGHFGHHHIAADADGRFAFVSNPGNGTIQVISLQDLTVVTTWTVGGKPSDIVAVGGLEDHHH